MEKQSFNGDEWTGILLLPDSYSGRAIEVHVYGAEDDRKNIMTPVSIFKTPESIISQNGGTAISENGKVNLLLPQNAAGRGDSDQPQEPGSRPWHWRFLSLRC